jgi:aflatoxin B1 aldehyde reductase
MAGDGKRVKFILGTMTFGREVTEGEADRMLGLFLDAGHREVDTAAVYSDGRSEEILGRILTRARSRKVFLATKVKPRGPGGLRPTQLRRQFEASLKRLGRDSVDLLYLHAPDLKTPIESTLQACQELFEAGKFRFLGLSNYAAWQVVDIWHICGGNGWVAPTVYQGMYNAVTRDVEPELLPSLQRLRAGFYAYNPLAGGLLTGKHVPMEKPPGEGRFALYPIYQDRYWKRTYHEAMNAVRNSCAQHHIPMAEAALRWLRHHSSISGPARHGVLVGATRVDQLEANLRSWGQGPLPPDVVAGFDSAWEIARPDCQRYFRT